MQIPCNSIFRSFLLSLVVVLSFFFYLIHVLQALHILLLLVLWRNIYTANQLRIQNKRFILYSLISFICLFVFWDAGVWTQSHTWEAGTLTTWATPPNLLLWWVFPTSVLMTYLPGLVSNYDPSDLYLNILFCCFF
jgi:membrane-associated HD superfamily phosphohydrolase